MLFKACLNGARDVEEHPRLSADACVIAAEARAARRAPAAARLMPHTRSSAHLLCEKLLLAQQLLGVHVML